MLGGLATKKSVQKRSDWSVPFVQLGEAVLNFGHHLADAAQLLGLRVMEIAYVLHHPA